MEFEETRAREGECFGVMQTMLRNYRDEGDYAITTFKACATTPGACLTCKLAAKIAEVLGEQLLTSMNKTMTV